MHSLFIQQTLPHCSRPENLMFQPCQKTWSSSFRCALHNSVLNFPRNLLYCATLADAQVSNGTTLTDLQIARYYNK
jgi:hypothetical protein